MSSHDCCETIEIDKQVLLNACLEYIKDIDKWREKKWSEAIAYQMSKKRWFRSNWTQEQAIEHLKNDERDLFASSTYTRIFINNFYYAYGKAKDLVKVCEDSSVSKIMISLDTYKYLFHKIPKFIFIDWVFGLCSFKEWQTSRKCWWSIKRGYNPPN